MKKKGLPGHLLRFGLLTLVICLPIFGMAGAPLCANIFRDPMAEIVLEGQTQAYGKQNTSRPLADYLERLWGLDKLLKACQANPRCHWVDVGGGSGRAVMESFIVKAEKEAVDELYYQETRTPLDIIGEHKATVISYENILDLTYPPERNGIVRRLFNRLLEQDKIKYLSGRFFEHIPAKEIGKADLITDLFGAFSYSGNKFAILTQMVSLLNPGGTISIRSREPYILYNGKIMGLQKFLKDHPIPGMHTQFVAGDVGDIIIQPTAKTLEELFKLTQKMKLIEVRERSNPPADFFYRYSP